MTSCASARLRRVVPGGRASSISSSVIAGDENEEAEQAGAQQPAARFESDFSGDFIVFRVVAPRPRHRVRGL